MSEFHQERVINGVLSHRDSPKFPWVAYTAEELSEKIEQVRAAAQLEIAEELKQTRKDVKESIEKAAADAKKTELNRILAIIQTEDELKDEPPSDHRAILERMDRVQLARTVVKATKQSIIQRVNL